MGKYVNPFTDTGFKILFGQEPSKPLLIDFLNNLLEGKERITDVTFLDKEKPRVYKKDRGVIYDILCETDKKEKIIVEMQNRSQEHFIERSVYYVSQAIARQGVKGDWDFNFHAVYFVAFMNFTLDGLNVFRTDAQLCKTNTKERELLSDKMKFIYLQLPLFTKTEDECKTNFDRWIFIFKNMATLEYIPWAAKDSIFSQLGKFAQIANLSEHQRRKYDKDLKIYRDNINVLDHAIKSGIEQGVKIGIEKGRAEGEKIGIEKGEKIGIEKGEKIGIEKGRADAMLDIARSLKAAGKLSFEEIAEITKLPLEEIEKL